MVVGLWPEPPVVTFGAEFVPGGELRPHAEYRTRPLDWIVDKLGVARESLVWGDAPEYDRHAWDGTREPLCAILEALSAGRDVGVESSTGSGKSFLAACVTLWFLACWEDSRVYTYAPVERQLRLYMWAEMSKLWPRFVAMFPKAVMTDLRIRMDGETDRWSAHGFAVKLRAGEESATAAQGAHAPDMLVITEETPGIDPSVMTAIENTRGGDHNPHLALGNPDSQHDELHRFCVKPGVVHIRISALDHPNVVCRRTVVPGATGYLSVESRRQTYGEDNRLYLSRVRGISPAESQDAIIKGIWIREAQDRYGVPEYRKGAKALGVDVAASEDGDKAAIARWQGACLMEVQSFPCPDPVELGLNVGVEIKASGIDPRMVGVDSVAVGAGTVGRLKEMGYKVQGLNAGAKAWGDSDAEARARTGKGPARVEEFGNLRSQMWWQMRLDLQEGTVAFCDDPELVEDLTTPTWFTRNGKIMVEPKEEIVKRLGRSPDKGDAVVLGNWVRERPTYKKPDPPKKDPNIDPRFDKVWARLQKAHAKRGRA